MKITEKITGFIGDLTKRATSRKFIAMLIAVGLHLKDPQGFTGNNMVWVIAAFIGFDVVQKFVQRDKNE